MENVSHNDLKVLSSKRTYLKGNKWSVTSSSTMLDAVGFDAVILPPVADYKRNTF